MKGFKAFIDRGNLLQLAVAFILGVAFAAVIASLVNDIIMPVVGLATGGLDFANLFVVLKDGFAASSGLETELKGFVKDKIAPYKYPRWIEFVAELPKTATGKIQRFKLRG